MVLQYMQSIRRYRQAQFLMTFVALTVPQLELACWDEVSTPPDRYS